MALRARLPSFCGSSVDVSGSVDGCASRTASSWTCAAMRLDDAVFLVEVAIRYAGERDSAVRRGRRTDSAVGGRSIVGKILKGASDAALLNGVSSPLL